MSILQKSALVVTIIGAVNWGLIGLFQFNLVAFLFGDMTAGSRIVYSLIGITGIINLALLAVPTDEM